MEQAGEDALWEQEGWRQPGEDEEWAFHGDSSSRSSPYSTSSDIDFGELLRTPSSEAMPSEGLSLSESFGMAGAAVHPGGAEPALGHAWVAAPVRPPSVLSPAEPQQIKPPPTLDSKALRHSGEGQMLLADVIKHAFTQPAIPRPPHLLTGRATHADLHRRIFIEKSEKKKLPRRPDGSDKWKYTSGVRQQTQTFRQDATGRRSLCEPTDAGAVGTIEATRREYRVYLRDPKWVKLSSVEQQAADKAAEEETPLRADGWELTFNYTDVNGARDAPLFIAVFHILPRLKRRVRAEVPQKQSGKRKAPRPLVGGAAVLDQSSEQQAAERASDGTRERPRMPPTVIENNRDDDDTYLSFESRGKQQGAIKRQNGGVVLASPSGDIAEYYRRAEGEPEFEEGDVVGFVTEGGATVISRTTAGAITVGVISHMAIVQGKLPPDPRERHKFDPVALIGQVPVKVRGPAAAGDVLVPSGRHDGTAVVTAAGMHGHTVGHVMRESEAAGISEASEPHLIEVQVSTPDIIKPRTAAKIEELEMRQDKTQKSLSATRYACVLLLVVVVVIVVVVLGVISTLHSTADNRNRSPHIVTTDGCGAENVSAIQLVRCNACGTTDAIIRFEHQPAGHAAEVACPVGFVGTARRTCTGQNRSTLSGHCRRLECPRQHLELPGGTVLTVAPVAEGHSQITTCPQPGFTGKITQQCLRNSTWGQQVGRCMRHMCSPSVEYSHGYVYGFNSSEDRLFQSIPVKAPQAEYGHSVQVAICRQFTRTGSCMDGQTAGDAGYVGLNCDSSGRWNVDDEASLFMSALSYDTLRMSKSLPLARSMYHTFATSVAGAVQPPTGSSWILPVEGVLTPVTIGLDTERREVFATANSPTDRADRPGSIDTNRKHDSQSMTDRIHALAGGRAAAAFARVACAEFGFKEAPFVTSCQGLASLLDDLPYRPPEAVKMLGELCPEIQMYPESGSECPNWLEVRDPPSNDVTNTQMEWLRASSRTPADTDGFHAAPIHEVADIYEQADWRDPKSFADVGPVPESPSCDGSEDSVLRCFQRQMIIPIARRKSWKRHCSRRIIVGCSDPVDPAPDDFIRPELGAAILGADIKALPDYSGFAINVVVRPADFDTAHANLTIEATLTLYGSENTTALTDDTRDGCPHITRNVPALISLFPRNQPTSFKLQLPPQCRYIWSSYQPLQYQIALRLHSFSTVVDTFHKYAKLRSVTASDGTWVVGDSVRPYPDGSTPLTRPKIFVDTSGPFNCTTGDLATEAEIIMSAARLCWGKTIRSAVDDGDGLARKF